MSETITQEKEDLRIPEGGSLTCLDCGYVWVAGPEGIPAYPVANSFDILEKGLSSTKNCPQCGQWHWQMWRDPQNVKWNKDLERAYLVLSIVLAIALMGAFAALWMWVFHP